MFVRISDYVFRVQLHGISHLLKLDVYCAVLELLFLNLTIYRQLSYKLFNGARGSVVVEARSYKPEGREFNTRWGKWIVQCT
jgi:hypothetical protein